MINERTASLRESHIPDVLAPAERPAAGTDLWGTLRRGKWLILLALACALGIAYRVYTTQTPVYRSTAKVLIKWPTNSLPISTADGKAPDYRRQIQTQIALIRSARIAGPAVEHGKLVELPAMARASDPVSKVVAGLTVTPETDDIVLLSYSGEDPEECRAVLAAVVDSYGTFLQESYETLGTETVRLISSAKDDILQRLQEREQAYRGFRDQAPQIWRADTNANLHRERLAQVEQMRSDLHLERTELMAELEAVERALEDGGNREAIRLMVGKLAESDDDKDRQRDADGSASTAKKSPADQLWPLLLEEQILLDELGPDHPNLRRVRRKIELTRQYFGNPDEPFTQAEAPQDFVAVYLDSLRQRIKAAEIKAQGIEDVYTAEREQLREVQTFEVQDEMLKGEIDRLKQLFDATVTRLGDLSLAKDYGTWGIEEVTAPKRGEKISPQLAQTLAMGGALGLLAGVVLAFVRERSDRRFVAPEDIHLQLGIPVVGHIPHIRGNVVRQPDSEIEPIVCTYHRPQSRHAESFRAVRTALYFSTAGEEHKVIQITSPGPGDGKSTLAANLAVAIANSGRRVLLVDCDFRQPRVHRLFNLSDARGLAQLIESDDDLDPLDAAQESGVENLWCVPCGPRPDNPSELLTSARFGHFLDLVREKFDYIVIDSPPMLAVTDPSAVAARVDGVLLTLRLNKNSRSVATRAAEMLATVGATVLGVVVNGIGHHEASGYGYRSTPGDGYGRNGYSYAYGYGDGYGDKESRKYYREERDIRRPPRNGAETGVHANQS